MLLTDLIKVTEEIQDSLELGNCILESVVVEVTVEEGN